MKKFFVAIGAVLLGFIIMDIELLVYGCTASFVWTELIATKLPHIPTLDWKFFAGIFLLLTLLTHKDSEDKEWEEILQSIFTKMCVCGMVSIMVVLIR